MKNVLNAICFFVLMVLSWVFLPAIVDSPWWAVAVVAFAAIATLHILSTFMPKGYKSPAGVVRWLINKNEEERRTPTDDELLEQLDKQIESSLLKAISLQQKRESIEKEQEQKKKLLEEQKELLHRLKYNLS